MYKIGLTGTSGSGKSTVAKILRELGAYIIDCDEIAHKNMAVDGIAYTEIIAKFGEEILNEDRTINRRVLGGIVFNDREKLGVLNSITHKYITEAINLRIKDIILNSPEYKYIVIDAPLLFEAGLEKRVDSVWVVTADLKTRIERIELRDGITKEAVSERLKNQKTDNELIRRADVVLYNDGDLKYLKNEIMSKLEE